MPSERPQNTTDPVPSALLAAHIVYALHALAIVLGITGAPTVIGSFVGSLPSIVAVVISYLKRGSARGSWAESHYRWQIRTFWFALLWVVITVVSMVTLVGAPIGFGILVALTVWLVYRIGRGWLGLLDKTPMYG